MQTSDALGAAGAQLGPNVAALVAELHTGMGLPLAKVSEHLKTKFGLDVTPGGLVHLLHRTARAAAPAYAALCEQVRHSPVVTPDETGWRVNALRHWLWAFATPETTVYAICDGRGFADAAAVLGPDFAGVLVRDGWVAYRGFKHAPHQSCLSHLLRRCKELQENHPYSPWAGEVQAVLQDGLALRDRCNAGDISEHGLASARGRLAARLGRLIDAPPPLADAERFAKHLANEFPAVFLFLCDPSIDATNWRAEQAIRPAVVTRKVCGGNRTRKGADTQQVLASVLRTARQRHLDLPDLIATMLWCARLTGEGQPVEVRRKEGVTNHFRPESCAGRCEAAGEALTGARTGRAIEHRKRERLERRDCHSGRRQHRHHRNGEGMAGSTVSENPCTFVRPSSGPGRSSFCPGSRTGAAAGRRIPYPMMHGMKKSDEAIVPVKAANKGAQTPAESPEGRASTKGNLRDQSTHRT